MHEILKIDYVKQSIDKKEKQTGVELCQAQDKLGLAIKKLSLSSSL